MLPWQAAANAQQFGLDAQQQHKKTILFGTDGTNSPSQFKIPGSYVSNFGPDISSSTRPLDKSLVAGVAKYGPYGAFGVPTYEATDVVMKAIASVCKSGQTPSRSNVLAAIRKTNIAAGRRTRSPPTSRSSPTATSSASRATCSRSRPRASTRDLQQVVADLSRSRRRHATGPSGPGRRRPGLTQQPRDARASSRQSSTA